MPIQQQDIDKYKGKPYEGILFLLAREINKLIDVHGREPGCCRLMQSLKPWAKELTNVITQAQKECKGYKEKEHYHQVGLIVMLTNALPIINKTDSETQQGLKQIVESVYDAFDKKAELGDKFNPKHIVSDNGLNETSRLLSTHSA